jgi:hypothetical protein
VAIGMEEYAVVETVGPPKRSPDDVVVVPSCHLGDHVFADGTAPLLCLPQREQTLPTLEGLCQFGAEALRKRQCPRRIVGIGLLLNLHLALQPQLRGLAYVLPLSVSLTGKHRLASRVRAQVRPRDPLGAFRSVSALGPGPDGVENGPLHGVERRSATRVTLGQRPSAEDGLEQANEGACWGRGVVPDELTDLGEERLHGLLCRGEAPLSPIFASRVAEKGKAVRHRRDVGLLRGECQAACP